MHNLQQSKSSCLSKYKYNDVNDGEERKEFWTQQVCVNFVKLIHCIATYNVLV